MSCRYRGRRVAAYLNRPPAVARLRQNRKMSAPHQYLDSYIHQPISLDLASESSWDGPCAVLREPSEWCLPLVEDSCELPGEMRAFVGSAPVYTHENAINATEIADVIVVRQEEEKDQVFVVNVTPRHAGKARVNFEQHTLMDIRNAMAISYSSSFCYI